MIDWNSDYNYNNTNGSELSMLMGQSSCNMDSKPKLENFLGTSEQTFLDDHQHHLNSGHDQHQYMFHNTTSLHHPTDVAMVETAAGGSSEMNNKSNSSFGLSMIKNWLRNNSAPPPPENNDGRTLPSSSQTLSLSMNTGSQSSHPSLALEAVTGGGGESSSESKADAVEPTVTKKAIETFGQRTSIYRGVTRFVLPSLSLFKFFILISILPHFTLNLHIILCIWYLLINMFFFIFKIAKVMKLLINFGPDIDGQEGMRLICGITVAEEKDKLVKDDKVCVYMSIFPTHVCVRVCRIFHLLLTNNAANDYAFFLDIIS